MMDIKNVWQLSGGNDDALNKMFQQKNLSHLHSKLPLHKLKRNLLMGIVLALLITALYVAVIFYINIWQVDASLIILSLFNIFIGFDSYKLYRSINVNISATNSLKEELQKNLSGFKRWWRIQERLGLFVYPIGAAGGFILGGVLGSGKPVEAFLYHPKILLILAATITILVPLCYFGARWMFNYAYEKHLKKIKSAIDDLS